MSHSFVEKIYNKKRKFCILSSLKSTANFIKSEEMFNKSLLAPFHLHSEQKLYPEYIIYCTGPYKASASNIKLNNY